MAAALRERRHGARIDPAAEERTDRHVRHELLAHHRLEQIAQGLDALLGILVSRLEPVGLPVDLPAQAKAVDLDVLAGPDLFDVAEERAIEQRRVEVQVFVDRLGIRVARYVSALQQRFDLAREDDPAAVVVVVELLDAQRVASEDEPLMACVPERKPEDARHVRERTRTIGCQRVEEGFRVGRPAKPDAARR